MTRYSTRRTNESRWANRRTDQSRWDLCAAWDRREVARREEAATASSKRRLASSVGKEVSASDSEIRQQHTLNARFPSTINCTIIGVQQGMSTNPAPPTADGPTPAPAVHGRKGPCKSQLSLSTAKPAKGCVHI
ncbi:hypothetical protein CCR75_008988 [Bremia lactucae]|uniref:Uncharacterized protein n=1 Tax=Bremia lactucae TaxID=4779 RepID=A0A976IE40_BRELC|nr:hypothetical protein CCR75_008988 [Bremia lactucae]